MSLRPRQFSTRCKKPRVKWCSSKVCLLMHVSTSECVRVNFDFCHHSGEVGAAEAAARVRGAAAGVSGVVRPPPPRPLRTTRLPGNGAAPGQEARSDATDPSPQKGEAFWSKSGCRLLTISQWSGLMATNKILGMWWSRAAITQ